LQKEQVLLFLSTKQVCFVVSCPLIIACSAFADTHRKGEVQVFRRIRPKTLHLNNSKTLKIVAIIMFLNCSAGIK